MKRLFFALWPDDIARQKIAKLNQSITSHRLKKVRRDNLHMTLAFLGPVSDETEQAIRQGVNDIVARPVKIIFDQLTLWRKGGILSLASAQQPQQLLELVDALNTVVSECGISVDSRPYKAHVTLARKVQHKPGIQIEPICWQATSFVLVESVTTAVGVDYQVLERWPLA